MHFNFPHLSYAYANRHSNVPGTLTAQILDAIAHQILSKNQNYSFFPQRIPRLGFFNEIKESETQNFTIDYQRHCNHVLASIHHKPNNLGLYKYALRIGLNKELLPLLLNSNIDPVEVDLLCDLIETRTDHEQNKPHNLQHLYSRFEYYMMTEDNRSAARVACRIIVKNARYRKENIPSEQTAQLVYTVDSFLKKAKIHDFNDLSTWVTLKRGLPMATGFTLSESLNLITKAVDITKNYQSNDPLEKLLIQELLYTTTLSLGKTYKAAKQPEKYMQCILTLTQADEFDSSAWSEAGLAWMDAGENQKAQDCFEKSYRLGPPAISMNAYFAGLCALKQQNPNHGKKWLQLSAEKDMTALSPRIELVKLALLENKSAEARNLSTELLTTQDFREQLTDKEISWLSSL